MKLIRIVTRLLLKPYNVHKKLRAKHASPWNRRRRIKLQIYQSHYLTSNGAQSYPTALRFFWRHSSNLKAERSFCALIWPFHGSHFTLKSGIIWWSFLGKTIFHRWSKLLPVKNGVILTHISTGQWMRKASSTFSCGPPNRHVLASLFVSQWLICKRYACA